MKRSFWLTVLAAFGFAACSQPPKTDVTTLEKNNTLLWKISGNGLSKPSYLFGTMHMICADDIGVSDSLKSAIKRADRVYLELDMNDMSQIFGALNKLTMRNDTTLADVLNPEEYKKVKTYFETNVSLLPFSLLEKLKPMLVETLLMEQTAACENMIVMEKLVTDEAKKSGVSIKALETVEYQLSIFDSIPYSLQAKQLVKLVENTDKNNDKEMQELTDAYRQQRLDKMDELINREDMGIKNFTEMLLYNRNANWTKQLKDLMQNRSLVIAVGAGHLPGDRGVINLLRKAGYKVEPVKNDMIVKKVKEI